MKHLKVIPAFLVVLLSAAPLCAQEPTFQDFLGQFPSMSLPFSFQVEDLQQQIEAQPGEKAKVLGWEYYHFLPELERSAQYSSMPVHPQPLAAFETEQYHAVLYNVARGLAKGSKTYSISVFAKDGAHIGTHFVAGVNAKKLTVATIDQELKALVREFDIRWEQGTRPGELRQIIGLQLQDTQTLRLDTPGNPDQVEWSVRLLAPPSQPRDNAIGVASAR
jgi:hypothetical protein